MSVEVIYRCSGCPAEAVATRLARTWGPVSPGGRFCRVTSPTIESAAPEGWIPFDPYTGATYCPTCWAAIVSTPSPTLSEALPPVRRCANTQPDDAIRAGSASLRVGKETSG